MIKNITCLLIVLLLKPVSPALCYTIDKIGFEDGLSSNNIVSITQDRDGYMWFCTKNGLNRFDANMFKVFKHSDTDSNTIISNVLNYVYADKHDDLIWIATEKNGLDIYNYRTNSFTHYQSEGPDNLTSLSADGITHISSDSKGNIWLATYLGGFNYFDKTTKTFTRYNQSNIKGLGSDFNWTLWVENDETIYLGHVNEGFSIVNLKTKTAVNFRHDPNNPNSLIDNTVTCIFKDSQNNIWIGTRNGLSLFDPETYQIKNFVHDPENPYSLSNDFIQDVIETKSHELWIGSEGGGVSILDLSNFSKNKNPEDIRFRYIKSGYTIDQLSSSSVQSLKEDSFGNIWIGGLGGGINFIPKQKPFFNKISYLPITGNLNSLNSKTILGVCVDKKNRVWVANGFGGIAIYNKGEKIKQINNISNQASQDYIVSLYSDSDGDIWVGTSIGQLFEYDFIKKRFIEHKCFKDIRNIPIYSLFEDSKKNIWLSTDYGLFVYNPITTICKSYTTANSDLSDNVIRAVSEDSYGNIWVGTLIGGLCIFDSNFNLILNYGTIYDFYAISHIYRDSRDQMWIASQNDLFCFKNYTNGSVKRYSTDFGLNEKSIKAIIEGKDYNELWVSTLNGICHIDLQNNNVSNFSVSDKIAMGDYHLGAVAKTLDGTIYFGSQNGITWFNQDLNNLQDILLPNIKFTNFFITDNKKNINEFIDIPFSDTIKLKHHQNSLQIGFNVLDYAVSNNVEYAFKMKGVDEEWYFINKDKRVTFRNLKPGNYVFSVKARLHNKEWSNTIESMFVFIKPPLWLTTWAKLIYIILVFFISMYILRFYKNKLKIENDLQLEKQSRQQEHDLNEEKLKFFTNITHELRTPMTLILGPLEDLLSDDKLTKEQCKKVSSIQIVANRLLQLINQILEFRKTQNKNRKLRVAKDNFVKYVSEIGSKYKDLNKNTEIDFQIHLPAKKIEMFFDPEVISIIIDNLISNAIKYTLKGTIKLKIKNYVENNVDYTEVSVEDTGFGISPEDLPHIFERYYQAKNASHPIKGTGIGLALVKNLVELHEADITVKSQLKIGTTFKVKFITNNSYPEVIHVSPVTILNEQDEHEVSSEKVILVVDDNQEIVEYIHDNLVDNYKVLTAENGQIGYDVACEQAPNIVITDIMMPVMDGIEMCEKMKMDVRTSHIPVILLTAKGSTLDQSKGYSAGADSYLTKPFSVNLLKSRITNILQTREKLSNVYTSNFKNKQQLFNEATNQLDKEFLEKLTEIIEKNIEDEEMSISFIAAQLNMSHSTMYRKVKALTGLTANEYIRKVRINFGEQLLITNQYSISEIMYKIGINSSSYFRQCFKDEFGMNPSDYLQKLKDDSI
jgi:signal transduction histidine kinase/ligand-binding sensor domain-containing protein/DNA-binding response OmpR family regulator